MTMLILLAGHNHCLSVPYQTSHHHHHYQLRSNNFQLRQQIISNSASPPVLILFIVCGVSVDNFIVNCEFDSLLELDILKLSVAVKETKVSSVFKYVQGMSF